MNPNCNAASHTAANHSLFAAEAPLITMHNKSVRPVKVLTLLVAFSAAALVAVADPIPVFNTGVVSTGIALPGGSADPHWSSSLGGQATVLGNPGAPVWQLLVGTPWAYIGVNNSNIEPPAPYSFTQTFDLTGFDPTTAVLAGVFAIDDTGTLSLNGHVIDSLGTGGPGGQSNNFSVDGSSGFFNSGENTLTIAFSYTDQLYDATGLIINRDTSGVSALPSTVPDAGSTIGLLGLALTGLFAARRKFGQA